MTTDQCIISQFDGFLRQFFPLGHFRLFVQKWPHLHAIATAISDGRAIDETTPYVDFKSLANYLEGVVVERGRAEQPFTIIEGQFLGRKSKLTIVMPVVVA